MPDPVYVKTQYNVDITIDGDNTLTTFVTRVEIINSIYGTWPVVYLTFEADNQEIIEKNFYGQSDIKMEIYLTKESGIRHNALSMDLLYLQSNLDLPPKKQDNLGSNKREYEKREIVIQCIPKQAYLIMTKFINYLFEEPAAKTPFELMKELIEKKDIDTTYVLDNGSNLYKVNQMIIPPGTIKRMIDIIDEKFSIYKGPLFRYCSWGGKLLIWDLYERYNLKKDTPVMELLKIPSYYEKGNEDRFLEINKLTMDNSAEHAYYVVGFENTETIHYANAAVARYGYKNTYITHPRESLYHLLKREAPTAVEEQGIWHNNKDMKINTSVEGRKMYYHDIVGHEDEGYSGRIGTELISSRMAQHLKDCCTIQCTINRNIDIFNVQKVGEVLVLNPEAYHEFYPDSDYSGAYIFASSKCTLYKKSQSGADKSNYDASCTVTGIRSVQTKV